MTDTATVKVYSLKDISKILNVTERTLHTYIKVGKIKGQKVGGRWLVSEVNLQKFLNGEG